MDDVFLHEILDSTDDLVDDGDGCDLLNPTMLGEEGEEVSVFAVLSDDVAVVICSVDVVALHDVGVI